MHQNHRGSAPAHRGPKHLPRVHRRTGQAAARELDAVHHLVPRIEQQHPEPFGLAEPQLVDHERRRVGGTADDRPRPRRQPPESAPEFERGEEVEGLDLADPARLAQLRRRRAREPVKRSVLPHQIGRDLQGAPGARSRAQQEGQQLRAAERGGALMQKPLARIGAPREGLASDAARSSTDAPGALGDPAAARAPRAARTTPHNDNGARSTPARAAPSPPLTAPRRAVTARGTGRPQQLYQPQSRGSIES